MCGPDVVSHELVTRLEPLLQAQLEVHRELLECLDRMRDGVRRADLRALEEAARLEATLVERQQRLETQRVGIMQRLTASTAAEVAETLGDPEGPRLLAAASELRDLVGQVQRTSGVVRAAAETLSTHLTGIVRTVHAMVTQTPVYGRDGHLAHTAPQTSIDIRS